MEPIFELIGSERLRSRVSWVGVVYTEALWDPFAVVKNSFLFWCLGVPTEHPDCVLDGRSTLGADAHDLLLSEQTRSFITATLNHCFTQLEPHVTARKNLLPFSLQPIVTVSQPASRLALTPLSLCSLLYSFCSRAH